MARSTKLEIWKPVVGYEGFYEVSNRGRVRSLDRYVGSGFGLRISRGRVLASVRGAGDYLRINLCHPDNPRRQMPVHKVVLEAFRGPRPAGNQSRHLNGRRPDCRLSNLKWETPAENREDMRRHGTIARGERAGVAKLTASKVSQIRRLRALGVSRLKVAKKFGINFTYIWRLCSRRGWAHVP